MPKGYKKDGTPIGGKRIGAGSFSPYGETTKTFSVRCPVSKEQEFKAYLELKLKSWRIDN